MVFELAHGLVRQDRGRVLEHGEALFRRLVRNDYCAGVLERLAAGDVIEMVVAVDQVLDRLVGYLLDFVDIGHHGFRAAVADRIGRNHAGRGDNEHRLVVAIAENVDVVGPIDLLRLEQRPLRRRRLRPGRLDDRREHACK